MLDKELKNERLIKNFFSDFDEWSKLHYYAFKLRKIYPNLFFHYFNFEGIINDTFTSEERKALLTNIKKFKNSINGMSGYLSLLLKNKNGILIYKMLNNSEFYDHSISTPCIQDASSKFSEEIHVSLENNKIIICGKNFCFGLFNLPQGDIFVLISLNLKKILRIIYFSKILSNL